MKYLVDPYGRQVTYLRVSVTDRCNFRCKYCMSENMSFLPKENLLTLEELHRICIAFIRRGVKKIRLTGGEPLVRRNIMSLVGKLGEYVKSGQLDELTVTTNGSQLAKYAAEIAAAGIKRINVSLDTLNPDKFQEISRCGRLNDVLKGLEAAKAAGLEIKINTVHGQDNPSNIEKIMVRFIEKKIDVLVCTSIIESGIDIPNANTIIINKANRMGLSQRIS